MSPRRPRLESVDALRGLVMVVMALDHTRDFFGASVMDPRDPTHTALFLTRWVTHFCAPVFVFLAGTSAYLAGRSRSSKGELSRFLATRGLWLVLLEFTVVRVAWTFDLLPGFLPVQVIWAIGCAMLLLALLIHLPLWAIASVGFAVVALHNTLDGIEGGTLWMLAHGFGPVPSEGSVKPFVAYAWIPWVGVMALGYAFGAWVTVPGPRRARIFAGAGVATLLGFVLLRAWNGYGDPTPWQVQGDALGTLLSFVNCEKYPPSLLFLLMTLGPALLFLAWADGGLGRAWRPFVTVGRVPLFYYVLHLYLIHGLAIAWTGLQGESVASLLDGFHPMWKDASYGYGLPTVYVAWLAVVGTLYLPCRWFAEVKQRRRDWWLSYL